MAGTMLRTCLPRAIAILLALRTLALPPEVMASQGERVSRWLPTAGEYRLDGEYGTRDEDWLEGVAGVAVAGSGEVVVYDAASARIVVLSPDLKFVREFGREGRGPGELQRLPFYRANPPPKNVLSVADTVLAVYDGVTVHTFGVNGSFGGYASEFPRGSVSFWGIVGMSYAPGALVYAIDTRGQQSRELQTWHATDDTRRLLFSVPLAPLPATGESRLQARPQWAVYGDEVFVSDGESDMVLRFSITRAQTDTIRLPHAGGRSGVAEGVELPRLPSGQERPTPRHTAEWRWENMVTDPDGFLWIAPHNRDRRRKLRTVFVVDPESGRAWRLEVPALPRSFGAPGVYYSAEAAAPDLIHVVRRYRVFD